MSKRISVFQLKPGIKYRGYTNGRAADLYQLVGGQLMSNKGGSVNGQFGTVCSYIPSDSEFEEVEGGEEQPDTRHRRHLVGKEYDYADLRKGFVYLSYGDYFKRDGQKLVSTSPDGRVTQPLVRRNFSLGSTFTCRAKISKSAKAA